MLTKIRKIQCVVQPLRACDDVRPNFALTLDFLVKGLTDLGRIPPPSWDNEIGVKGEPEVR